MAVLRGVHAAIGGRSAKTGALFTTGVAELDSKLKTMAHRVQGRIIRQAMVAAMQPVLAMAKETIPVDSGYTKRRLRIKPGKPRRDGARKVSVGIFGPARHGRGKGADKVATGRIIEFGKEGSEGQMILRRALGAKQKEALSTLTQHLRAGVLRNIGVAALTISPGSLT